MTLHTYNRALYEEEKERYIAAMRLEVARQNNVKKPMPNQLALSIIFGVIAVALFLLSFLLAVILPSTAYPADLYLEVGLGPSIFQHTTADGIWIQKPFPNSSDFSSLAWKAGMCQSGSFRNCYLMGE